MKKVLTLVIAVIFGIGTMLANPVDVNTAQTLGQKFVQAKFDITRTDMQLCYTVTSDNGAPCAYVFNIGNEGFVIVAASDNVRPILGYSNNGPFDSSNPYNGAMYMLETYKNSISYAIEKNIAATPEIAEQWVSLEKFGRLGSSRGGKVEPLVWTKWNQDSPYNLYAPAASGGPGGRCYAGCVATAMSQVMKFWDYPTTGIGSHSYYCSGYGQQSANFGATTYDWENMPKRLSSSSTQVQKEAVATLMYHCGVSVDMMFAPNGSGAFSDDVPAAMNNYFDYDYCVKKNRSSYSLANWLTMLKQEFDLGHPVYYSGQSSSGGHAFVADGYDEDDFVHFNFGWGGSDDDYYAVDAIDYNSNAAAIFNYVPSAVYEHTAQAPTNVTIAKTSDVAQEATLTWEAPTKTLNNQTITPGVDNMQMVVERDGIEIYRTPATTGTMTYVDSNVPCYSTFEYQVYAVYENAKGVPAKVSESFGPTCDWQIVGQATNTAGWKSGYIVAFDGANRIINMFTMTNNTPVVYNMPVTIGKVTFKWKAASDNVPIVFKIKNPSGEIVYEFSGNTNDVPTGVLYTGNNGCGQPAPTDVPEDLHASKNGDDIVLTWQGSAKSNYGFNVYRDGALCALVQGNEYVDVAPTLGGHCYQVCLLGEGGESGFSNEACATPGDACNPPRNLWYYWRDNGKPAITWEAPNHSSGLSAFFVYRKKGEDGNYGDPTIYEPTTFEHKETGGLQLNNWYYYKVVAYYENNDCYSSPARALYANEYYVKIYYSPQSIGENVAANVEVYPNPAKDMITVKAENMSNVMVYNSIGQKVFEQELNANETTINTNSFDAGIYMVRIVVDGKEITRKISVVK